jgi:hypothetical protein
MMDDKVKGYWHVYSDGKRADIPFGTDEDKIYAMNSIAICAYANGMEVVCLEVNDTHLHAILRGDRIDDFRSGLKRRLTTHSRKEGENPSGEYFIAAGEIQSRNELLTKIIYTFRNCLDFYRGAPWDYPWGVGNMYFVKRKTEGTALSEFSRRERYRILECRYDLPDNWRIDNNGLILPSSYIDVDNVERLFGSVRAFLAFLHIKKDNEQILKQSFSSNYIEQRSIQDIRERANRLAHQKFGMALRNLPFESRLQIAAGMIKAGTASRSESLAKAVSLKREDLDRLL